MNTKRTLSTLEHELAQHPEQEWPDLRPKIRVSWYTCNCDYLSKYCDEYHQASALVPASVLEEHRA